MSQTTVRIAVHAVERLRDRCCPSPSVPDQLIRTIMEDTVLKYISMGLPAHDTDRDYEYAIPMLALSHPTLSMHTDAIVIVKKDADRVTEWVAVTVITREVFEKSDSIRGAMDETPTGVSAVYERDWVIVYSEAGSRFLQGYNTKEEAQDALNYLLFQRDVDINDIKVMGAVPITRKVVLGYEQ